MLVSFDQEIIPFVSKCVHNFEGEHWRNIHDWVTMYIVLDLSGPDNTIWFFTIFRYL